MDHQKCIELVKNSKSFKGLNYIQQSMIKKHKNMKEIQHCLILIKNIGFAQWEKQEKTSYLNRLIINELSNEQ